jgi:hypothetical protein
VDQYFGSDTDYLVSKVLSTGIKFGASDIHLESTYHGMMVRYRIDGVLQTLGHGKDGSAISNQAKPIILGSRSSAIWTLPRRGGRRTAVLE